MQESATNTLIQTQRKGQHVSLNRAVRCSALHQALHQAFACCWCR